MNCQDALDLLYDIIDREASEIDTQQVKEHLENCRDCFEVYRLEQSVQDFINEKIKDTSDAPRAEELKSKILTRLDEIDRENPNKRETSFFRLTTRTLVAAASLVILIGASLLIAAFYRHGDNYIPLERAHWAAVESFEKYQNGQTTTALLSAIRDNHQFDISDNVMNFSLLGAASNEIMGTRMSHLVYRNEGKIVSVFLVPAGEFQINSDLQDSRVIKGDITFFDHHCRGCRLVYHVAGSLIVITASTDDEVDLFEFVPELSII